MTKPASSKTRQAVKGVGIGAGYWRVLVRYKDKELSKNVRWIEHGTKEKALAVANALSLAFHKKLGKPLQRYVVTKARSSTGHIGISENGDRWLVELRGKGFPAMRSSVLKSKGIRFAVAVREAMLRSRKASRALPPMVSRQRREETTATRAGD